MLEAKRKTVVVLWTMDTTKYLYTSVCMTLYRRWLLIGCKEHKDNIIAGKN
jgi:hypothetical protein